MRGPAGCSSPPITFYSVLFASLMDALKAPSSTRRNQKFAHVIMMASAAEGPRHSAGRSTHVRPLQTAPGTATTQATAFASHLQQVYQATDTQPRVQRPGLQLQQRDGLVEQQPGEDPPVTTSEVIDSLKRLRLHKWVARSVLQHAEESVGQYKLKTRDRV